MAYIKNIAQIEGIKELFGLYNAETIPERFIAGICSKKGYQRTKIYIFSDNTISKGGIGLATYIKQHKLGDITETEPIQSRSSGNKIQTWIWSVHTKALENWKKENQTINKILIEKLRH